MVEVLEVATYPDCWEEDQSQEGKRSQNEKTNCSVNLREMRCSSRTSCKGQEGSVSPQLG